MFINLSGTPGELKSVSGIGVVMSNPIGAPSLEIRAGRLTSEKPRGGPLGGKPLGDPARPVGARTPRGGAARADGGGGCGAGGGGGGRAGPAPPPPPGRGRPRGPR